MAPNLSRFVTPRNSAVAVGTLAVAYWLISRNRQKSRLNRLMKSRNSLGDVPLIVGEKKKERTAVDMVFFGRLVKILKLVVPGFFSKESGYLFMVAFSLIARTYCDIWMIQNGTSIERSIIGRDYKSFKKYLLYFIYAMPAISIVNSTLKYGLNELKLLFRVNLSEYFYDQYLRGFTYYKMSNLDNRIANADQLLTQDTERFCNSIVDLYSNLSKPLLDILIYIQRLTASIGPQGPSAIMAYLAFSGLILTRLRRPLGRMTVTEQRYEGEYRFVNSRVITNSEEIAFYQGNEKEKNTIRHTFGKLIGQMQKAVNFRLAMGFVDNIIAKYWATVMGYLVVSRPFLDLSHPRHMHSDHSEIMQDYYMSGRMLVKLAEAIGRIVLAGRELTRLAGFTTRMNELIVVLEDLNRGKYERTMISSYTADDTGEKLVPGSGQVVLQDHVIRFEHAPLVTPNGDVLLQDMNFEVKAGKNVLICGPNGCGKSSLFRVLGELWPLFGGKMVKPEKGKLFYIPQRPYMTIGTFRDQLIYPDTHDAMTSKGLTDKVLEDYLEKVQLSYLLDREGGWNSIRDWMDVLSGGEKQRIAMARVFYHKPQFAILDECTSAVSVDVEGFMYQYCKQVGITLFTVSHRKSLWRFHEYYMKFYRDANDRPAYEFKPIEEDTEEFGS